MGGNRKPCIPMINAWWLVVAYIAGSLMTGFWTIVFHRLLRKRMEASE